MNIISNSGTNALHGSWFFDYYNQDMGARLAVSGGGQPFQPQAHRWIRRFPDYKKQTLRIRELGEMVAEHELRYPCSRCSRNLTSCSRHRRVCRSCSGGSIGTSRRISACSTSSSTTTTTARPAPPFRPITTSTGPTYTPSASTGPRRTPPIHSASGIPISTTTSLRSNSTPSFFTRTELRFS